MSLTEKEIYKFGHFILDATERELLCEGTPVSLTPKAFDTLLCLVRNHGHMLTKDELLNQVWPDTFVEEVNLAVTVSTSPTTSIAVLPLTDLSPGHDQEYFSELTSLQQRLVKTGGRLVKHARYYWLLLAESHLTRRLFGSMLRRMAALPLPTG
jgi:hypothetical protein